MACVGCPGGECSTCGMKYAIDQFEYDESYSKPSTVLLGLTSDCNLACPYCFVHQSKHHMTLATARKAVELALKNTEEGETCRVFFFGGEPLLRFESVIVPIVQEYNGKVEFSITTNGVLLDEDKVDFLYKNNVTPLLSFDGVKDVQDTQRPGKGFSSFDAVVKNIPYLLFRFPMTTMRSTVTRDSIPFLEESYQMGKELGFHNFGFCPNEFEEWDDKDRDEYQHQLELIAEDVYVSAMKGKEVYRVTPINNLIKDAIAIYRKEAVIDNSMKRCGTGTNTFSVTPQGDIVPCQEKVSNPTFIIGDVDEGIIPEKHREYLEWYWDSLKSLQCNKKCHPMIRYYCMARICASRVEDVNFRFTGAHCAAAKAHAALGNRLFTLVRGSILPAIREAFELEEET